MLSLYNSLYIIIVSYIFVNAMARMSIYTAFSIFRLIKRYPHFTKDELTPNY